MSSKYGKIKSSEELEKALLYIKAEQKATGRNIGNEVNCLLDSLKPANQCVIIVCSAGFASMISTSFRQISTKRIPSVLNKNQPRKIEDFRADLTDIPVFCFSDSFSLLRPCDSYISAFNADRTFGCPFILHFKLLYK